MAIPQFKMNANDPSTEFEIAGTQEASKNIRCVFRGKTLDGSATELFLDGVTNKRLKVHDPSVMTFRYQAAVLGPAAATSSSGGGVGSISNFAGTTALVGAIVAETQRGAADVVAFTADDTNDTLKLTVTAATAVTKYWEVVVYLSSVTTDVLELIGA